MGDLNFLILFRRVVGGDLRELGEMSDRLRALSSVVGESLLNGENKREKSGQGTRQCLDIGADRGCRMSGWIRILGSTMCKNRLS